MYASLNNLYTKKGFRKPDPSLLPIKIEEKPCLPISLHLHIKDYTDITFYTSSTIHFCAVCIYTRICSANISENAMLGINHSRRNEPFIILYVEYEHVYEC